MDKTKKNNVRLNFDFPKEEYPYLKMMLAHKGVSLREFMCELILNAIEDYEDDLLAKKHGDTVLVDTIKDVLNKM